MNFLSKIFGIDRESEKRKNFQAIEHRFATDPEKVNFMKATWLTMRGNGLAQHYRFDQATEDFKGAIKLDANHFSAYVSLGMIYVQTEMFKEAIDILNKVPKVSKFYESNLLQFLPYNLYWALGIAYNETGYKEKAIYYCEKFLEQDALMEAQKNQTGMGIIYQQNKGEMVEKAKTVKEMLRRIRQYSEFQVVFNKKSQLKK